MYNGIGLATPRGSGTNGYVQRNFALVRGKKEKVDYKTEDDIKRLDAAANKKPNQEILDHERKRKLELKCMELEDLMEEQGGYSKEEIELKVSEFRRMLMDKDDTTEKTIVSDEFGRPIVRETHQIAEANQEKNQRLREAFGISQYFVEGSSLDPNRREKEKAAAQASEVAQNNVTKEPKVYSILSDSSSSTEPETKKKKKKKQVANLRDRSESPDKKNKKKKSKKHKRERSESTSPPPKKKKKTRDHKHKHKKSHSPIRKEKKKRKYHSSSESDNESSSDSDSDERRLQKKDDSQSRKQSHVSRNRIKDVETYRSRSPNVRKRVDSSDQRLPNSNQSPPSVLGNCSPAHYDDKSTSEKLATVKGRYSRSPETVHPRKDKMKSVIERQANQELVNLSESESESDSDSDSSSDSDSTSDSSSKDSLLKQIGKKLPSPSKLHAGQPEAVKKHNSVVYHELRLADRKSSPLQRKDRDVSPQQTKQTSTKNGCGLSPSDMPSQKRLDKGRSNRSRSRSASLSDQERNKKKVLSSSPPRAYGGKARSRSHSLSVSASRSPTPHSKSRSKSKSASRSWSRSRSRSQSYQRNRKRNDSSSRSQSFSPGNRRRSRSRSRSFSRNRSRSNRSSTRSRSRSRSHSSSDSRSRSPSTGRRSPSIPRRRGSPSFLDKRRITRRYPQRRLPYQKFSRRPSPKFQRRTARRSPYQDRYQPRQRHPSPPPLRKSWRRSRSRN